GEQEDEKWKDHDVAPGRDPRGGRRSERRDDDADQGEAAHRLPPPADADGDAKGEQRDGGQEQQAPESRAVARIRVAVEKEEVRTEVLEVVVDPRRNSAGDCLVIEDRYAGQPSGRV